MIHRRLLATAALLSLFAFTVTAHAGEITLTLKDFVGRITIETSGNSALKVTDKTRASDVNFDTSGDDLTIDGGISEPDGDGCKGYYGSVSWSLFSKKEKQREIGAYTDLDDYPNLTISGPEDLTLIIENAIPFGSVGTIGAADIEMSHCGRLVIGDINGPARFIVNGSGDIKAGNIQALQAKINGSGDLEFADAGKADISIRGSGDVDFISASDMNLSISGSGDADGESVTGAMYIKSSGSGDVDLGSVGRELTYDSQGSGDLSLDDVIGTALIQLRGSSSVDIDDGDLTEMTVVASGSSDMRYGGKAGDVDLTAKGSSDIYVNSVTGTRNTRTTGSGDVHIAND